MNFQTIGYPILSAQQKKELDKNTIISEPIPSNDLLERACYRIFLSLKKIIKTHQKVDIICGQGNNGADGLCLARILAFHGYKVCVYKLNITDKFSVEYIFQNDLLYYRIEKDDNLRLVVPDDLDLKLRAQRLVERAINAAPRWLVAAIEGQRGRAEGGRRVVVGGAGDRHVARGEGDVGQARQAVGVRGQAEGEAAGQRTGGGGRHDDVGRVARDDASHTQQAQATDTADRWCADRPVAAGGFSGRLCLGGGGWLWPPSLVSVFRCRRAGAAARWLVTP